MDVGVEERRQQPEPAMALDQLLGRARLESPRRGQLGDLPAAHTHVVAGVDPSTGIEHVHVAKQGVRRGLRRAYERMRGAHAS
jgi:hypothetical protein